MESRPLWASVQIGELVGKAAGRPAGIRKGLDARFQKDLGCGFSHWGTAGPHHENSPGGQGTPSHPFHPPVSSSAWHMEGTLQIFGEEERGVKEGGTS